MINEKLLETYTKKIQGLKNSPEFVFCLNPNNIFNNQKLN